MGTAAAVSEGVPEKSTDDGVSADGWTVLLSVELPPKLTEQAVSGRSMRSAAADVILRCFMAYPCGEEVVPDTAALSAVAAGCSIFSVLYAMS